MTILVCLSVEQICLFAILESWYVIIMAILVGPNPVSYDTVIVGIMAILNDVSLHNPGKYVL